MASTRHAGLLVPLFSIPSTRSWGIGEIGDFAAIAPWMRAARLDLLQILPVTEIAAAERSPYSALSAMAIDPIYISVHLMDDFAALGGEAGADAGFRRTLHEVRHARRVDYAAVRTLKMAALRAAFDRFIEVDERRSTERAGRLAAYVRRQAWWIDDYALYRALGDAHGGLPWTAWPSRLRERRAHALVDARRTLERHMLFYQYLQWIADAQWQEARRALSSIGLYGDLPFTVSADSADVWKRQHEFRLDASVGTPPDTFSETGQDWGLPPYRWDVGAASGFDWFRDRARRAADLFTGYRVDHLVGFYRTFIRPETGGEPFFDPAAEPEQTAQGERVMQIFKESGADVTAEDLGTVPDFVRESLARLEIPGYRVMRWEREWDEPAQPFRDPARYPPVSVATTGTHDTDPLADWWDALPAEERGAVGAIPGLAARSMDYGTAPFSPELGDALLEVMFASGSSWLILPVQDLFGWRDRINVPGTLDESNWTYKLPWPVDRMLDVPESIERAERLAEWAERYARGLEGTLR